MRRKGGQRVDRGLISVLGALKFAIGAFFRWSRGAATAREAVRPFAASLAATNLVEKAYPVPPLDREVVDTSS
ncbi:hypothetical protein GW17_00011057 [Ensete ventricosum]|nr:hypothetical protein GW17_00011057 [Ensete ventricosum]